MGMGHVPPGSLRQASQGDDVPGREHRGARAELCALSDRRELARVGEQIAAAFLRRRGATIVATNVLVGRGEIDLLVRHHGDVVAVEVKTVGLEATANDPIERIDDVKLRQVRRLASAMKRGVRRVDFVGVRLFPEAVVVNWRANVG